MSYIDYPCFGQASAFPFLREWVDHGISLCWKSLVNRTVLMYSIPNLHNTEKEEDLTKSTSVVPAKYLPNVELENFSQLYSAKVGVNYAYLCGRRFWGSHSGVDLTLLSWEGRHFLMGRTLHQIFKFFEMVFLVDDPQLWLGVGCKAFPYQDSWWALPTTWEPLEYHASPFIGFICLGSVPFVGSIHIKVRLTKVRFLWIHFPTEMCSSVLSCHQLYRSKNTLISCPLSTCVRQFHPERTHGVTDSCSCRLFPQELHFDWWGS